jgi:hypothetical protein
LGLQYQSARPYVTHPDRCFVIHLFSDPNRTLPAIHVVFNTAKGQADPRAYPICKPA